MNTVRLSSLEALADRDALASVIGPIAALEREPMSSPAGFSGSRFERLRVTLANGERRSFVVKRTAVTDDWLARQTGDSVGREAMLLGEPRLAGVWEVFASPYLAYAMSSGSIGLLMEDLADHLPPDVREPLPDEQEEALLSRLARMHARYWNAPELDLPWLAAPQRLIGILHPRTIGELAERHPTVPVLARARDGWKIALERLPREVATTLQRRPEELWERYADLPRTLLHGDSKVANFAFYPDDRVMAFDWTHTAAGPVGVELGWYVTVNASRLTASKDQALARYRALLEEALRRRVPDAEWERTVALVALTGAMLLLWSKALALAGGSKKAEEEWAWYVERLARA